MSHIPEVQRVTKQQLPQAIAMISRAFHEDPLSIYLYPDEAERRRRLPLVFGIPLWCTWQIGDITATPELTGAACWLLPEQTTLSAWQLLRSGAVTRFLKLGGPVRRRLANAEAYMTQMHQPSMRGPHWYLWTLGVEPTCRGQGIGGMLLSAGLARADSTHLPCYLETMNPANVPLYEHFGFAVESEGTIPDSSVRMWGMSRLAH